MFIVTDVEYTCKLPWPREAQSKRQSQRPITQNNIQCRCTYLLCTDTRFSFLFFILSTAPSENITHNTWSLILRYLLSFLSAFSPCRNKLTQVALQIMTMQMCARRVSHRYQYRFMRVNLLFHCVFTN